MICLDDDLMIDRYVNIYIEKTWSVDTYIKHVLYPFLALEHSYLFIQSYLTKTLKFFASVLNDYKEKSINTFQARLVANHFMCEN